MKYRSKSYGHTHVNLLLKQPNTE